MSRFQDGLAPFLPDVEWDLLKSSIASTLRKEVRRDTHCNSGWEAITLALRRAAYEKKLAHALAQSHGVQLEDAKVLQLEYLDERALRAGVVTVYLSLNPSIMERVIKAKLNDPLSYFKLAECTEDRAWNEWTWYLLSLTHSTEDFEQGKATSAQVRPEVAHMPLDMVDLQVIAHLFDVQIVISRFEKEEMVIPPRSDAPKNACHVVHLLEHRGRWSTVLGMKTQEENESEPVIVTLGDLPPGPRQVFSRQDVLVKEVDVNNACLIVVAEQTELRVEREEIAKVKVWGKWRDLDPVFGGSRGIQLEPQDTKAGELFEGIHEGAREFQVLLKMVIHLAAKRFDEEFQAISGRGGTRDGEACSSTGRESSKQLQRLPGAQQVVTEDSDDEALEVLLSKPSNSSESGGTEPGLSLALEDATVEATPCRREEHHQVPPRPERAPPAPRTPLPLQDKGVKPATWCPVPLQVQPREPSYHPAEAICELLAQEEKVFVVAPKTLPPKPGWLEVEAGDEVQLHKITNWHEKSPLDGRIQVCGLRPQKAPATKGWVRLDDLLIFLAQEDAASSGELRPALQYQKGAHLLLDNRDTGMVDWASGSLQGEERPGFFSLSTVQPCVQLSRPLAS